MESWFWRLLGVPRNSAASQRKLGVIALLYFIQGAPAAILWEVLPVYFRLHGVSLGIKLVKPANGIGAAPRVESDQGIARRAVVAPGKLNPMAEAFEHSKPAQGGDLVAVVEAERRRRDQLYVHAVDYFAQVRKPAKISRRSGV